MTMSLDLIQRLTAVTEPDREIDCLIWAEVRGYNVRYEGNKLLAKSRRPPNDQCWLGSIDPGKVARNFSETSGFKPPIPAYTGSVDAAMTLVATDAGLHIERYWLMSRPEAAWSATISTGGVPDNPRREFEGMDAYTPAIAICIAAIHARAATEDKR